MKTWKVLETQSHVKLSIKKKTFSCILNLVKDTVTLFVIFQWCCMISVLYFILWNGWSEFRENCDKNYQFMKWKWMRKTIYDLWTIFLNFAMQTKNICKAQHVASSTFVSSKIECLLVTPYKLHVKSHRMTTFWHLPLNLS